MRRLALLIGTLVVAGLAFGLATRAEDHDGQPGAAPEAKVAAAPAGRLAAVAPKKQQPPTHDGHAPPGKPAEGVPPSNEEPRVPIDVPLEQQERIGLQTAKAEKKPVQHTLRTVGSVVADERREAHVHTRVAGWIEDIRVSAVGAPVKKGQVLYRLYAPELASTQAELVAARGQGDLGGRITKAALDRLSLWGVAPSEIEALRTGGPVKRALSFLSPADGYVVDKMAAKGMYVTPDMELYKIADLTHMWIIVTLYENELPLVTLGDETEVALTVRPEMTVKAPITYIYPELDTATRTGRARVELDNKGLAFKPGMFANVSIKKDLGEALIIPADAVLFTGQRNLVFVKMTASMKADEPEPEPKDEKGKPAGSDGSGMAGMSGMGETGEKGEPAGMDGMGGMATATTRFAPKEVVLGPRTADGVIVLNGIDAGDEVVVRASFLIDAESRLQAAMKKGDAGGGHAGMAGMDKGG